MNIGSGKWLVLAAGAIAATPALAAEMSVKLTIPSQEGNNGRAPLPPYVAVWLRKADKSFAGNLAVWYMLVDKPKRGGGPGGPGGAGGPDQRGPAGPGAMGGPGGGNRGGGDSTGSRPLQDANHPGGARWINEVREWWADSGHELKFPVDGLTSASRAAGTYDLAFSGTDPKLANLPAGNYLLMVEATREHGGDETISIPFTWPVKSAQSGNATGKTELGAVALALKP